MRLTLIILSSLLILNSCKYEDGPGISFRSKTERISNSWFFEKVIDADGVDVTDIFSSWAFSFNDEGRFELSYSIIGLPFLDGGSWNFYDKKRNISINYSNTIVDNFIEKEYRILKLKERELILEGVERKTTFHLKPI